MDRIIEGGVPRSFWQIALAALLLLGGLDACASTQKKADEVHSDFKESIKPAAEFVDEKANAVADEGKKGVKKLEKAVGGDGDGDEADGDPDASKGDEGGDDGDEE